MLKKYVQFQIIASIFANLAKTEEKKKTKILHLNCGDGELVEALMKEGFEKVYGSDEAAGLLTAARKRFDGKKNARFKKQDMEANSISKVGADVVIAFEKIPFAFIPAGTKVIVLTVFANYEKACLELSPFIANGATTVQHGPYFLTIGIKK